MAAISEPFVSKCPLIQRNNNVIVIQLARPRVRFHAPIIEGTMALNDRGYLVWFNEKNIEESINCYSYDIKNALRTKLTILYRQGHYKATLTRILSTIFAF